MGGVVKFGESLLGWGTMEIVYFHRDTGAFLYSLEKNTRVKLTRTWTAMKKGKVKLIPLSRLRAKWLKDPEFKKAYDDLAFEFQLIDAIISAGINNGLTQKDLAKRIGTKQSAIARFESGRYNQSLFGFY